jgi:hypothetical protein
MPKERGPEPELWQIKTAVATLAVCMVRTLEKSDPDFEKQFLETLDRAYYHFRENAGDREVIQLLETLSWTRELLTGWNMVTGQNEPFLKP